MKENGWMIKLMAKVYTYIKMAHHILVNGLRICSMAMELKNGWMDHLMKGTNIIMQ
jgi:hypothetical protein